MELPATPHPTGDVTDIGDLKVDLAGINPPSPQILTLELAISVTTFRNRYRVWQRSARFSFAAMGFVSSPVRVNRRKLRVFLIVALLVTALFTAWTWFRPYAWNPDPAARCTVKGAHVRQDHSFFWLDLHLKVSPGQSHDLMKPVRLVTSKGRELEAADTTMVGGKETGTTDLWFKFWLDAADLEGPLTLRINDGSLSIKSKSGMPALGSSKEEFFPDNHW